MSPRRSGRVSGWLSLLLLLAVVGLVLGGMALGWIRFESTADQATIEIETGKMKRAAAAAVDDSGETLGKALEEAGEALRRPDHDDPPQAPPADADR